MNIGPLFDQPPPADTEAEGCLLGALILKPDAIPEVFGLIRDEAFTLERHAVIWRCILAVNAECGTIDLNLLLPQVRQIDPDITGEYLVGLASGVPSGENAPHYAARLAQLVKIRRTIEVCGRALHRAYTSPEQHMDIVAEATEGMIAVSELNTPRRDVTLAEASAEVVRVLDTGEKQTLATGITSFDDLCGGFPIEGLVTLLGIPSSGKSTVAANLAYRWAVDGYPVRVFSFEQPSRRIAETLIAAQTGVDLRRAMRMGTGLPMDDDRLVRDAAASHGKVPLEFVDELLDARQIEARCELYAKRGVRIVIVDYLQNLPMLSGMRDHYASVSESARILQRISRRLGLLVVMLCQVDKEAARGSKADKPVRLSDAFGGATVSMVTDFAVVVHRPWLYDTHRQASEMKLVVRKSKYSAIGEAECWFDPVTGRISDTNETPYAGGNGDWGSYGEPGA